MNMIASINPSPQLPAVSRILSNFDRGQVEAFVEIAIAMLDTLDGDADDQDTSDAEDDFAFTGQGNAWRDRAGPSCPIADPKDIAWIEVGPSGKHGVASLRYMQNEDDEDGDADGQCSEDEISCAGNALHSSERGPGCPISDPGGQCDEDDISALGILPYACGPGCLISDDDHTR